MNETPGRRLIPTAIDEQAQHVPDKVFASIPRSSKLEPGCYRDVTMADFARGIDRLCEFLEPHIGFSKSQDTVAYYGLPDMRYQVVIVAMMKLGYKTLVDAPRNTHEMHAHLFKETDCSIILHAKGINIATMLGHASHGKAIHAIPSLEDLISKEGKPPKHYPYNKTFEEVQDEEYLVVHTSGSTGMPKIVSRRPEYASIFDILIHHPPIDGRRCTAAMIAERKRVLKGLPPWHPAAAEGFTLLSGTFGENCTIWFPPDRLPNAKDAIEIIKLGNVDEIGCGIDIFQVMASTEEGLKALVSLDVIWYGGGRMDEALGNKIVEAGGNLRSLFGSTETGVTGLAVESDAWDCVHWHPSLKGMEFRDLGGGMFEQFLVRDPESDGKQAVWAGFPQLKEWPMKDIYSKHEKFPNHWRHEGRTDDLIVFRDAGKYNPLPFEGHCRTDPLIEDAFVAGTGHNQAVLLIQMDGHEVNEKGRLSFVEKIWPTIQKANESAPKHGRIAKSHVLLTTAPFETTSKGTTKRAATLQAFQKDIAEVYKEQGDTRPEGIMPAFDNKLPSDELHKPSGSIAT